MLGRPALRFALFTSAVLSGCAGSSGPSPRDDSGSASAPRRPALDGRIVYLEPIADAPEPIRTAWTRLRQQLTFKPPKAPSKLTPEARDRFAEHMARPWLMNQLERLKALAEGLGPTRQGPMVDRLFGLVVLGYALDDAIGKLEGIDAAAMGLTHPRDLPRRSAQELRKAASTAWRTCAKVAPRAPAALAGWSSACTERAARAASKIPVDGFNPGRPLEIPAICEGDQDYVDPDAPPPDASQPERVAVVWTTSRFRIAGAPEPELSASDRGAIVDVVAASLRQRGMDVLDQAMVRAAERLHAERRWTADGPQCGQAPPLAALVAAQHPAVVLARVTPQCFRGDRCRLSVGFDRAGTVDDDGLPRRMEGSVEGAPEDAEAWLDAARRLEPSQEGGLGMVRAMSAFRVLKHQDEDPWMRTVPTLVGLRSRLEACITRRGLSALDVNLSVDDSGTPTAVRVEPRYATEGVDTAALTACVTAELRASRWPCPRAEGSKTIDVRVCLGRR